MAAIVPPEVAATGDHGPFPDGARGRPRAIVDDHQSIYQSLD
jgi:hypothetical protein